MNFNNILEILLKNMELLKQVMEHIEINKE